MRSCARRSLPNLITLANLCCGAAAALFALQGDTYSLSATPLLTAAILILAGAICDVFDGLIARWLNVAGPLGKELDSLADLISFGLAPAAIYTRLIHTLYPEIPLLKLAPLILIALSALRLAHFNIDTKQSAYFRGLATPASAMLTCGIALHLSPTAGQLPPMHSAFLNHPWIIPTIILAQSILLVVPIPMFSLKIKSLTAKSITPHLLLVAITIPSILLMGWAGLAIAIIAYIALSLLFHQQITASHIHPEKTQQIL